MSLNKVQLIGNLGRDPEIRNFPDGGKVANVTLATTETWKDKTSGERREATEWHRLSFNNRLAEIAEQYLKKGAQIYIEGSLRTRKYTQEGVEKYTTEIRVDQMQMLGGKGSNNAGSAPAGGEGDEGGSASAPAPAPAASKPAAAPARAASPAPAPAARASSGFDDMDDDIPF